MTTSAPENTPANAETRGEMWSTISRPELPNGNIGSLVLIASNVSRVRTRWESELRGKMQTRCVSSIPALRGGLRRLRPSVLLVDLRLTGLGGVDGVRDVARVSPSTRILVFAGRPTAAEAVVALKAGAHGYCHRDVDPFLLLKAIETLQKGGVWVPRGVVPLLVGELTRATPSSSRLSGSAMGGLTERQRQVTHLISRGASNREIASSLQISEKTVKAHLMAIFRRMGVPNRLALALRISQADRESGPAVPKRARPLDSATNHGH